MSPCIAEQTMFLHWGMGCLQLLQKAHSKQTQSWDQYPHYCEKWECICISQLLRQLLSMFNPLGLFFTVWTSKSPESPFSRHRKMFSSQLQGVHKLSCRIYHETQSHASKYSKQCGQKMTGYIYLSDCFVSQTLYKLLLSSKKNTFKGKDSFLSIFGLCTEIEICLLFSCSVTWLNPLHAVLQKWFWIFCWDQPSIQVHHSTSEMIPLLSIKQRVQNIHLWADIQVKNPGTTDVSFSVSAAPA